MQNKNLHKVLNIFIHNFSESHFDYAGDRRLRFSSSRPILGCSKLLLHFDIFISKSLKLRFIRIRKQMRLSIHLLGLFQ